MKTPWPIVAAALSLLSACHSAGPVATVADDPTAEPMGRIVLEVTDAPFALDFVSEARMSVDRITIYRQADSDSHPVLLYQGPPIPLNILELRDGITQLLADRPLPAGTYRKIRLHVASARLALLNGNVYETQDFTLRLSGNNPLGFRVAVDPPFVVPASGTIRALLDIDLANSFKPIPDDDALNASLYVLKAKIRAMNLDMTGGIHGTVLRADGPDASIPVEGATVYVLPPGATNLETAVTSTTTSATGSFAVPCLPPGTYDVLAVRLAEEERLADVSVAVGSNSEVGINFLATQAAAISGIVRQPDGQGGQVPVPGAFVYVLPPGELDPSTAIATAKTDGTGRYSMEGLHAGMVNLLAVRRHVGNILFGIELLSGTPIEVDVTIQ